MSLNSNPSALYLLSSSHSLFSKLVCVRQQTDRVLTFALKYSLWHTLVGPNDLQHSIINSRCSEINTVWGDCTVLSVCLSIYLSIYLSICLSGCLSVCLYLSIYPSIYPSIHLYIHPSTYISIHPSGSVTAVAVFHKRNSIPFCFSFGLVPNCLLPSLSVLLLSRFFFFVLFFVCSSWMLNLSVH